MMKHSIILLMSALPATFAYSQTANNLDIVVGRILSSEVSANVTFGYFDNEKGAGAGIIGIFADGGNISSIGKAETDKSAGFRIEGNTVHIDTEQAASGVKVFTLDGRTAYAGKATAITLPAGVYLLSINGNTQKIIVN